MKRKIQIVSPMWPDEENVHIGVFVKNVAGALRDAGFVVETSAIIRGRARAPADKVRAHARFGLSILAQTATDADCIYLHAPSWFGPLARLGKRKLIVHTHGGEVFPHSRVERLSQPTVGWLLRRADLVIAPSRYYADQLARTFGLDASGIFVSPSGGVDTGHFAPKERTAARRALRFPEEASIIGFVGRIDHDKGWEVFLDVLRRLPGAFGVVAGDGPDAEALNQRAERSGIAGRLRLLGLVPQPDLHDVYASLDAFLFPTKRDCLGLVPLEAMACGVPVVASNIDAVPEYVEPGKTGFLCAEGDAAAFAAATKQILDMTAEESEHMSRKARETALSYDRTLTTRLLADRIESLFAVTKEMI